MSNYYWTLIARPAALAAVVLCALGCGNLKAASKTPHAGPNVIVILAADQGYGGLEPSRKPIRPHAPT